MHKVRTDVANLSVMHGLVPCLCVFQCASSGSMTSLRTSGQSRVRRLRLQSPVPCFGRELGASLGASGGTSEMIPEAEEPPRPTIGCIEEAKAFGRREL